MAEALIESALGEASAVDEIVDRRVDRDLLMPGGPVIDGVLDSRLAFPFGFQKHREHFWPVA